MARNPELAEDFIRALDPVREWAAAETEHLTATGARRRADLVIRT